MDSDLFAIGEIKQIGPDGQKAFIGLYFDILLNIKKGTFYAELSGMLVPFVFEQARQNQDRLVVQGNFEKLLTVKNSIVWIKKSLLPVAPTNTLPYYWEIEGKDAFFVNENFTAKIVGLYQVMQGAILALELGDKEILVPYVKEFVHRSENNTYSLELTPPEGLVDLYLNTPDQQADEGDD